MYLNTAHRQGLAECFALLAEAADARALREALGPQLLRLLRADHFASYVWDEARGRFDQGVALGMSATNLARYEAWFQYDDPITFRLQSRRHATCASEVMPRSAFVRCAFFNDFLARDGLHWGVNLHAFDGDRALGDLRIWRGRSGSEFDDQDKAVLNLIEPAFVAALRRLKAPAAGSLPKHDRLSRQEQAVAERVARGMTDKQIAIDLHLSIPSVRTYLQRTFDKLQVNRRAALANAMVLHSRKTAEAGPSAPHHEGIAG